MAILPILRMGHPVLMAVADPIDEPTAPEIAVLVDDMVETMHDAPGIGLAAPQVGVGKRLVIYSVPEDRDDMGDEQPLTVLINPEITVLDDTLEEGMEGCLSLPGMSGRVNRPKRIRVRALGLGGEILDYEAQDFHARVIQHECDHLDGVLYPMRMSDLSSFGYVEEMTAKNDEPD